MMIYAILLGLICICLGIFIFLKPSLIWKFTEQWKSYRADEPSDFYLKSMKLGGIIYIMAAIVIIILPIVLE